MKNCYDLPVRRWSVGIMMIYKFPKYYSALAGFFTVGSLALFLSWAVFETPDNKSEWLELIVGGSSMILFGSLGLGYSSVTKFEFKDDVFCARKPFFKKQILCSDVVRIVRHRMGGNYLARKTIVYSSGGKSISIDNQISGYEELIESLKQRCANASIEVK